MPDYYATLGVSRTANEADLKSAYRKLARESHPDANPGDPHAEERFKAVSEAYAILSDPAKRQQYDTYGDAAFQGRAGAGGFGDLGDIMEAFFGGSPFGGGGRGRTRTRTAAVAGENIAAGARLTLEDAVFGCTREVECASMARCEKCGGDGCEPGTFRARCSACGGQGETRSSRQTILGTVMTARPCGACGGAGEAPAVPCTTCYGHGRRETTRTVRVDIPGGVSDGTTVRLRGEGEAGVRGGPDGDLFVQIRVERHPVFERDGDNLVCDLAIPLTQAVLGATIHVKTLDGEESITVAPGTAHGTVMRLRSRGANRLDGRGRGDLLVHLSVEIPARLEPDQRALFEQIAALRGEEVGSEPPRGMFRKLKDTLLGQ